jgi:hypothetical protein
MCIPEFLRCPYLAGNEGVRVKCAVDCAFEARSFSRWLSDRIDGDWWDSLRSQNAAAAIVVRARRRMGQILEEMPKAQGKRTDLVASCNQVEELTLDDLGVEKTESSRCQAIAAIPEEEFEQAISKALDSDRELTSKEMVKLSSAGCGVGMVFLADRGQFRAMRDVGAGWRGPVARCNQHGRSWHRQDGVLPLPPVAALPSRWPTSTTWTAVTNALRESWRRLDQDESWAPNISPMQR